VGPYFGLSWRNSEIRSTGGGNIRSVGPRRPVLELFARSGLCCPGLAPSGLRSSALGSSGGAMLAILHTRSKSSSSISAWRVWSGWCPLGFSWDGSPVSTLSFVPLVGSHADPFVGLGFSLHSRVRSGNAATIALVVYARPSRDFQPPDRCGAPSSMVIRPPRRGRRQEYFSQSDLQWGPGALPLSSLIRQRLRGRGSQWGRRRDDRGHSWGRVGFIFDSKGVFSTPDVMLAALALIGIVGLVFELLIFQTGGAAAGGSVGSLVKAVPV